MKIKSGIASDALILAFVQGIQVITGLAQAAILSRALSKYDYGTYSQGMLIINFVIPFLLLGLSNAVNYFNNQSTHEARRYVNNIFGMVVWLGILGCIIILALQKPIIGYFGNTELNRIMIYVSVRPLLQNIIALYLPLYISDGKTKIIAVRNLTISILQVIIIAVATIWLKDVAVIFALLLIMDIAQIILFYFYYNKWVAKITFWKIERQYISPILKYAVPLAISTMVSTVSVNMDKLLIGKMMSTEEFATYSLMSKELPFSFLVTAFTTVITPSIIRKISEQKNDEAIAVWKNYVQIGYKLTFIMTSGAVVCSEELLCFLYSDKYIDGIEVFIIYILVSSIRFTYYGLILSAYGKTNLVMYVSVLTLVCNLIFNSVFYYMWGMKGPALASLLVIGMCGLLQLIYSCKLLNISMAEMFNFKYLIKFMASVVLIGFIIFKCKSSLGDNLVLRLFVGYGLNTVLLICLHFRSIIYNLKEINGRGDVQNAD